MALGRKLLNLESYQALLPYFFVFFSERFVIKMRLFYRINIRKMSFIFLFCNLIFCLCHSVSGPWAVSVWRGSSVSQRFTPGWFSVCQRFLTKHQPERALLSISTTRFLARSLKPLTGKCMKTANKQTNKKNITLTYSKFNNKLSNGWNVNSVSFLYDFSLK